MKTKKTKKADLERKRFIFFEIGLILSLAIVFSSFEYGKSDKSNTILSGVSWDDDVLEQLEITFVEPEKEIIEPEKIEKPKVIEELNVVDDNEKEDDFIIETEDDGKGIIITEYTPIVTDPDPVGIIDFVDAEIKPLFPGGDKALLGYLSKNTDYPEIAVKNNIEGKVYVSFVIDVTGRVTEVEVINDFDPYLSKEAKRVVSSLPDWEPGKQRNIPVPVRFIVPIIFKLY